MWVNGVNGWVVEVGFVMDFSRHRAGREKLAVQYKL